MAAALQQLAAVTLAITVTTLLGPWGGSRTPWPAAPTTSEPDQCLNSKSAGGQGVCGKQLRAAEKQQSEGQQSEGLSPGGREISSQQFRGDGGLVSAQARQEVFQLRYQPSQTLLFAHPLIPTNATCPAPVGTVSLLTFTPELGWGARLRVATELLVTASN